MTRILLVDDEPLYHKMIQRALDGMDFEFETAVDGQEGIEKAREFKPDLIITDVMMPVMDGYAFTQALRRIPDFAKIPILVLSAQSEIQDKLKSFEAGADDHFVKPFQPAELKARVISLLRRRELMEQQATSHPAMEKTTAHLLAFHTLRGGIGNSSLAVNIALALQYLWGKPTLITDLSMLAGEVNLLLNEPIKRSWADIAKYQPETLDELALNSIIGMHPSGLHYIAAPTYPSEAERISPELYAQALASLRQNYDYLVADLPHDFSDITLQTLDVASYIIVTLAPEMASVRAASLALETYAQLGYPDEKIVLALNTTFDEKGIAREKLEEALGKRIVITLPYEPKVFVTSLNYGRPVIEHAPESRSGALLEDFAFFLSANQDKKSRPAKPSEAWERVYKRFLARKKRT